MKTKIDSIELNHMHILIIEYMLQFLQHTEVMLVRDATNFVAFCIVRFNTKV